MEKLRRRLVEAERALNTLVEILREPYSKIVRDATIQRFEYSFELIWKALREYLYHRDGIVCNSPKSCFKEALNVGLISEDEALRFLEMTDDRNLTSHTYIEEIAEKIYGKMRDYLRLMAKLLSQMREGV